MTKKERAEIAKMAAHLPLITQKVFKKVKTKDGQEGYIALENGVAVNHKRRMKRAMKRHGKIGVLGYMMGVDNYLKKKQNGKSPE